MQKLSPGSIVVWKEEQWSLIDIVESNKVLLRHTKNSVVELVDVAELKLSKGAEDSSPYSLITIPQDDWKILQKQFNLLKPLLRKR